VDGRGEKVVLIKVWYDDHQIILEIIYFLVNDACRLVDNKGEFLPRWQIATDQCIRT